MTWIDAELRAWSAEENRAGVMEALGCMLAAFIVAAVWAAWPIFPFMRMYDASPTWSAHVNSMLDAGRVRCMQGNPRLLLVGMVRTDASSYPFWYGVPEGHQVMPDDRTIRRLHEFHKGCADELLRRDIGQ